MHYYMAGDCLLTTEAIAAAKKGARFISREGNRVYINGEHNLDYEIKCVRLMRVFSITPIVISRGRSL